MPSVSHVGAARLSTARSEVYSELAEESDRGAVASLVDRYCHIQSMVHQVLIIQPFIRYGTAVKSDTDQTLMLAESKALVETLGWRVVDTVTIGLNSYKKKYLFGSGNLSLLQEQIAANQKITAVFISMYQLTVTQRLELEQTFNVPVIDRYHLVLQIFYQHAASRESRLQVALAEIPYLKNRLMVEHEQERGLKHSKDRLGEKFFDTQRYVLKRLESNIRKRIEQLQEQRYKLRQQRKLQDVLTVAVIGYTNCGKTSLIKALTGCSKMEPRDQLFATLDVTCHGARLPGSQLPVVFIDTVGFISDIPTPLIASFRSTLEDALAADLLLHVVDRANPDWAHQAGQAAATLAKLRVPPGLLESVVTIGNKIDLLAPKDWVAVRESGAFPVSAMRGWGLEQLAARLEGQLVERTGRLQVRVRVRPGGEEWDWLHRHSTVSSVQVEPADENFVLVSVVITKPNMEKFKAHFVRDKLS